MTRLYLAAVGAAALLVAAACSDRTALTETGRGGLTPGGSSRVDNPVTRAVYTSTNPSDDTDPISNHDLCQNQKDANAPAINCNIYFDKDFVWLSGGPSDQHLGDGTYMFAVLEPGGQGDPNDCIGETLSDLCSTTNTGAGDSWQHRVFSIANGVITYPAVGYPGGHDFDNVNNMIRLAGYDNTLNPGGEYILAVCSVAGLSQDLAGPGVAAGTCKYDAFKVDETKPCENPESDDCLFHPQGSTVVTEVHLATTHAVVSNASPAALGSSVHDKATVTTSGGAAIPAGSKVSFYFWNNNTCTGDPVVGSPDDHAISGASGTSYDGGLAKGPLGAGEYSYQANFTSGDSHVVSDGQGECEPFKVNKANTTISTQVHNASHTNITNGVVGVGSYVHDNASVGTAVGSIAITGNVTFSFYENGTCTGSPAGTQTVAIGSESSPKQINAIGSYAYSAKYEGDANYNASSNADCEPFGIAQLGKTMGFWGNVNGIAAINAAGGYVTNAIAIGRSSNIDTQAEALKVLPVTLNACGKNATIIFAGQTATKDCTVATGINVGTLNTNAAQTLALGYNIKLIGGYTGQTIGSLGCGALITAGLTTSNSVNLAFAAAVALIDKTASGGTATQGQLGAMNLLLSCLNRES